jgi:hypothetical protein
MDYGAFVARTGHRCEIQDKRLEGLDAACLSSTMRGGNGGPDGFKNKDGQGLQ